MGEFSRVVSAIMDAAGAGVRSCVTATPDDAPPFFLAHARFDGKEYVVTVVPTDLPGPDRTADAAEA